MWDRMPITMIEGNGFVSSEWRQRKSGLGQGHLLLCQGCSVMDTPHSVISMLVRLRGPASQAARNGVKGASLDQRLTVSLSSSLRIDFSRPDDGHGAEQAW